ncbi:MAG: membrane dipeptidase, partial [Pararheinheimera sp.]|nr:membrane dipeptidase [Rheinheimera sp.]
MRFTLLSISLIAALSVQAQAADFTQQANKIAQNTLIIDTHIDVPYRLYDDWEDVTKATKRGEF